MKKLVFLFAILSIYNLNAQDTASVEYTFTISDEFNNSQELIIGKDPFGSEGLDPQFGEVIVPQVPAGQFGARFILPTDSTLTTLKDIRFGCYWGIGFNHMLDLGYASGSNQMTIDWDWNMMSFDFLMSVSFYNPYNGNLIQYFDYYIDSSFFYVPTGLNKLNMVVSYNGTLSSEWYALLTPNGGDTLFNGENYNITWSCFKLWPSLDIEFSSNGGRTWSFIEDNFGLNQNYYQWVVPNIISDSCKIRIGHFPCSYDTSDNYFSIVLAIPVELLSFSSSVDDDDVILNWITSTETNNSGFNIERNTPLNPLSRGEAEGRGVWETIDFVNGHGTTTEPQTYSYKDENLYAGKYQYRLKQIDFDGTFEYSSTIEVEINPPAKFSLEQNYPNPFNPVTIIKYSIPNVNLSGVEGSRVQLEVFDVLGNEVATLVNEYKPSGNYEVEFSISGGAYKLSSGIYYYQLKVGEFVQSKKMILMK